MFFNNLENVSCKILELDIPGSKDPQLEEPDSVSDITQSPSPCELQPPRSSYKYGQ